MSSLAPHARDIERVLQAVSDASSTDSRFWFMPDRRRFGYVDPDAIFRTGSAVGLPSSADEAEREARIIVQRVNDALGRQGTLAALKVVMLLPADLELLNATPVYDPGELSVDHWLCRFLPTLQSRWAPAPSVVSEATLAVRIGNHRRMTALTAAWSPVTQEALCSPIAAPDPRQLGWTAQAYERAAVDATDVVESGGSRLTYAPVQSPTGEEWLLPCHVFDEDPLQRRYPAARHRLTGYL